MRPRPCIPVISVLVSSTSVQERPDSPKQTLPPQVSTAPGQSGQNSGAPTSGTVAKWLGSAS
jgi:hypothetical protein